MSDTVVGNERYQFNLSNCIFIWGRLIAHNCLKHGSHSDDAASDIIKAHLPLKHRVALYLMRMKVYIITRSPEEPLKNTNNCPAQILLPIFEKYCMSRNCMDHTQMMQASDIIAAHLPLKHRVVRPLYDENVQDQNSRGDWTQLR